MFTMSDFFYGFVKRAEEQRPSNKEIDRSEAILAAASAGTALGNLGAWLSQGFLGRKLSKTHHAMPLRAFAKEIKDLKSHFTDAADAAKNQLGSARTGRFGDYGDLIYNSLGSVKEKKEVIDELSDIADLGSSFAKEHKLHESGIKFNANIRGKLGDYYNPIKNTVNMSTASRAVALHEMGHAADYRGSLAKMIGRKMPQTLGMAAIPAALAYGDSIREKIPGSVDDKVIDFLQKHPISSSIAGYGLSTLYPEARASYSALKHIYKHRGKAEMMKDLKKSLGPAYLTYIAGTLPIAAGALLAGSVRSRIKAQEEKKKKKNPLQKAAGISSAKGLTADPDVRAFTAGALMAGIPASAITYYLYGTKGGHVINDIGEDSGRRDLRFQYGRHIGDRLYRSKRKFNEFLEKHPVSTATASGVGAGALGGLLTAIMMAPMGMKKKAEEKEQEQGDLPLPRTISVAGPRLDAITEESDRSKFPTFRG